MTMEDEGATTKQGYLYIKRERATSPASRFFNPWQKGYFILRHSPFLLEEYKDSALKSRRTPHVVGAIKHVGAVLTSKSQPYAFEVVMKERSPLTLACDNQILLQEWISAFKRVLKLIKESSKESLNSIVFRNAQIPSNSESFEVEIIETNVSRDNALSGEYVMIVNPHRVSLCSCVDFTEVLSWPMRCMSYQACQPKTNRLILVMSKSCHFGFGKLMFETSDCEEISEYIKEHFCTSASERSSFYKNRVRGSSSSSESWKVSTPSTPNKSPSSPHDVFNSDFSPDATDSPNDPFSLRKVEFPAPILESGYEEPIDDSKKGSESFAEITADECYILPNVIDSPKIRNVNEKRAVVSQVDSIDTIEDTSYLQLVEEDSEHYKELEDDVEYEDPAKKLLRSLTSQLENPIKHQYAEPIDFASVTKSDKKPSTEINRRQSEPPKKIPGPALTKGCSLDSGVGSEKKLKNLLQRGQSVFNQASSHFNPLSNKNNRIPSISAKMKTPSLCESPPTLNRSMKPKSLTNLDKIDNTPPPVPERIIPAEEPPPSTTEIIIQPPTPKDPQEEVKYAPPLPPKSTVLPALSVPLNSPPVYRDNVPRSSSFSGMETSTPPELPETDYRIKNEFRHLFKDMKTSSSKNSLDKISDNTDVRHTNVTPPAPRRGLNDVGKSQTVEEFNTRPKLFHQRKMTVGSIGDNLHGMPKVLVGITNSNFPKSPKIFF